MNQENNDSKKCPICGRPTHKESKYCIFHASAEEKTEEEFERKLKELLDKIKGEDGDYDFSEFIFVGDIDFNEDLNIAIFKNANLSVATFKGDANLSGVTFEGNANLTRVTFEGDADLSWTTFKGDADLSWTTFKGDADLFDVTFEGDADLFETIFEGNANLIRVTFEGNANLIRVNFKKKADFSRNKFLSTYNFKDACFKGNVLFDYSIFSTRYDLNLKVNGKGSVSFKHACIENIFLELDLAKEVQIDFIDSILRNTRIEKDEIENRIIQEKKKKFSEAKKIYLLLKNNFHSLGQYDDESWAFVKEKEMERKSYYSNVFTKNIENKKEGKKEENVQKEKKSKDNLYSNWMKIKEFGKWLWSWFCNAIYGYGEKPQNVILSAIFIIILFATSFSLIGIANPEIIELNGTAIHESSGNIVKVDLASKGFLKNNVIRNFPDSLYFSLITFTTLGYGDFRPLEGLGRILAGSEAFIGAFMMALFVYTFARRTGGR